MPQPPIAPKALSPNPALAPLEWLIGEWRTVGTHPAFPGAELIGRTSFGWHEGGAFLVMRQEVDHPDFPDGVAIIGSDDLGRFTMIYFDERGVSRISEVTVGTREVSWRRDDPKLAQRLTIRAEGDGALVSEGRMSEGGGPWGEDLSQRFERG